MDLTNENEPTSDAHEADMETTRTESSLLLATRKTNQLKPSRNIGSSDSSCAAAGAASAATRLPRRV
ncbi:MAG: hypothetical protein ACKOEP_07175, partial [Phycisphaerales bacterium]